MSFSRYFFVILSFAFLAQLAVAAPIAHVVLDDSGVVVDGQRTPYLYGADVQYFRARGGSERNVPAATVNAVWEKLADRVLEARMNVVSVYIPWDFHEPVEGQFDFRGTLDQDHDGKPDYPSRNLRGFLSLFERRGIKKIILRPGPYINAEWGATGFGAIPAWFFKRYPEAKALAKTVGKPETVSFAHPIFRRYVKLWFGALYREVLKDFIGPGRPGIFLQLDNETNFFWDSVYERDYSQVALKNYREFLRLAYHADIRRLNQAYGTQLKRFSEVKPPQTPGDRGYAGQQWHYDWYLAHDMAILNYYRFLKRTWNQLGVREPDLLFTSCESFNQLNQGLLPRLDFRGHQRLALATMNIYPKTNGSASLSTLNQPMKAAHDALLIAASHRQFYGTGGNWLLTTETQSGWFPPTEVTLGSREHTYGSLLGAGAKGMIIYYFHEGWNWSGKEKADSELHFDAPLDSAMEPRASFALLKRLGEQLQSQLGKSTIEAKALPSPVLLAHDTSNQYPLPGERNALEIASTESGALYGLFREAGVAPEIAYLDALDANAVAKYRLIIWNSPGYLSRKSRTRLTEFLKSGGTVLWIGNHQPDLTASPGILWWKSNFASEWNTDDYAHLAPTEASARLAKAAAVLTRAGVKPDVELVVKDGKPFVHVWARQAASGNTLLFVENFLSETRELQLTLDWRMLPSGASGVPGRGLSVVRHFGVDDQTLAPLTALTTKGGAKLALPVGSDGIDIWEISAKP